MTLQPQPNWPCGQCDSVKRCVDCGAGWSVPPPGTPRLPKPKPARVGEQVERRRMDGCMAHYVGHTRRGRIARIIPNKRRAFLRHYPADEMCLLIHWSDGVREWHPQAAYYRHEDGVLRWDY